MLMLLGCGVGDVDISAVAVVCRRSQSMASKAIYRLHMLKNPVGKESLEQMGMM
jgi:hypothetical protein